MRNSQERYSWFFIIICIKPYTIVKKTAHPHYFSTETDKLYNFMLAIIITYYCYFFKDAMKDLASFKSAEGIKDIKVRIH